MDWLYRIIRLGLGITEKALPSSIVTRREIEAAREGLIIEQ